MLYSTLTLLLLQIFTTSTVLTSASPIPLSSSSSNPSTYINPTLSPKANMVYKNRLNDAKLDFNFQLPIGTSDYSIESMDLHLVMWKRRSGGPIHVPGTDLILAKDLLPNNGSIISSYSLAGICGRYELLRIEHRIGTAGEKSEARIGKIYLAVDCDLE